MTAPARWRELKFGGWVSNTLFLLSNRYALSHLKGGKNSCVMESPPIVTTCGSFPFSCYLLIEWWTFLYFEPKHCIVFMTLKPILYWKVKISEIYTSRGNFLLWTKKVSLKKYDHSFNFKDWALWFIILAVNFENNLLCTITQVKFQLILRTFLKCCCQSQNCHPHDVPQNCLSIVCLSSLNFVFILSSS